HRKTPHSTEMIAAIYPYMGDYILFCDFLEGKTRKAIQPTEEVTAEPAISREEDHEQTTEQAAVETLPVIEEAAEPAPIEAVENTASYETSDDAHLHAEENNTIAPAEPVETQAA